VLARLVPCALAALALAQVPAGADEGSLFQKPWRWRDERGAEVSFARWRGSPLIVTLGYTSCSSRCPIVLSKLQRVDKALAKQSRRAEFILVSLDPGNDTPAQLASFKQRSGVAKDNWHFLCGSESATQELIRYLGVRVINDDSHIDHETKIFVFDREGKLVRTLRGWDFAEQDAVIP
jgi:protein SCO1/2